MPDNSSQRDQPSGHPATSGTREDAVELTFPDLPRLELDQLLAQLVERAQEVMATQGRLRGLLRATQTVTSGLSLPVVLRRIAEAARELAGARYAALGVLAPEGGLAETAPRSLSGVSRTTIRRTGTSGTSRPNPPPLRQLRPTAAARSPRPAASTGRAAGHAMRTRPPVPSTEHRPPRTRTPEPPRSPGIPSTPTTTGPAVAEVRPRTTATGLSPCAASATATEPSNRPATPPRPRSPITTSCADRDSSSSRGIGNPSSTSCSARRPAPPRPPPGRRPPGARGLPGPGSGAMPVPDPGRGRTCAAAGRVDRLHERSDT